MPYGYLSSANINSNLDFVINPPFSLSHGCKTYLLPILLMTLYFSSENELGETHPDEDELIEIVKLTIKDAYKMLDSGEIADAKTVILLSKLRERLLK